MQRYSFLYHYIPAGLTCCLGVGVSVVVSLIVGKWESSTSQIQFQRRTDNLTTALQRSINRYTELLLGIGDFYYASEIGVERHEFKEFVQRALLSYPGIQALEWSPRVSNIARLNYEKAIQSSGYPAFQITERASQTTLTKARQRQEYFPVNYVEPWAGNELAFGFDLASDFSRLSALSKARDTGEIAATGRIKLVQEKKNQFGFLVFLPVYINRTSLKTPSIRREKLKGFVLGVFRVSDVVEESLQNLDYDINFYIYDQSGNPNESFLGFYDSTIKKVVVNQSSKVDTKTGTETLCPETQSCTRTLNVGGRQWSILFFPTQTYTSIEKRWGAEATLIIGLLLTSSLLLYLSRSKAELDKTKELSELKLRFFSMASHEFRTPLSTILVSAQSLETNNYELSEEQKRKNIQLIRSAAKKLAQLLTDILTLTRAEAGKLDFTPEIINLDEFCSRLIEEIQLSINTNQTIVFVSDGECSKANLDQKILRSILTNLLANAIKYSPANSQINFTLSCDLNQIIFKIQDEGIGIPLDDQHRLYETFYRGTNVGDIAGTGLGLAVVKTCVDLHGGHILFKSEVGVGTTFTVILPLKGVRSDGSC